MTPTATGMHTYPDLRVKKNYPDAPIPVRAHNTDSGLDLQVYSFAKLYYGVSEYPLIPDATFVDLWPGNRVLVDTGISATVGVGYEIQIRPRSGLALKSGLTVLNTPGTIDAGYVGPVCVILCNVNSDLVRVRKGDRIAQMVVCPVILSEVLIVDDLDNTERGSNGFGSSGV